MANGDFRDRWLEAFQQSVGNDLLWPGGHAIDLRSQTVRNGVAVRIYRGNACSIETDAIICGAISLGNPVEVLYRDRHYWGAGLAQGPEKGCPSHLSQRSDAVNVIEVDRRIVPAKWIGILNPLERSAGLAAALLTTARGLVAPPRRAARLTLVSPWRDGVTLVAALTAAIQALLAAPPDGLKVLNLVDAEDPSAFERMFEQA